MPMGAGFSSDLKPQAGIERLGAGIGGHDVKVNPLGAGGVGGVLGPGQKAAPDAPGAFVREEAEVDTAPKGFGSVDVEPAYGPGFTPPARVWRPLHDPEVRFREMGDEVVMLQAELISEKGVLLRLRPARARHLLRSEAAVDRQKEWQIGICHRPHGDSQSTQAGEERLRR